MKKVETEEWADPGLLKEVRKYGNFDTNACLNCGGCTITCSLSSSETAFSPRMSIEYVRTGLRKKLLSRLDPWLCYYCGDCSTSCPRQANPGETMMTLRRYLTAQYDWTGLASKFYKSKLWKTGSFLVAGVIVIFLIIFYHLEIAMLSFPDFRATAMGMEHMFGMITSFTVVIFVIPILFIISNAFRMHWLIIKKGSHVKIPFISYLTELKTLLLHILFQKKFRECTDKTRWLKHFLMASGTFVMCVIVLFFLKWFQTDNIYPLYHPQRWVGYLATIAILYGTGELLVGRLRKKEEIHRFSENSDFVFPIMLFLTAISGILLHIFRYAGMELAMHYTYSVHLIIIVPMLIIEIPFGKWSHGLYRSLALYFYRIQENALQLQEQKLTNLSTSEVT